MTDTTDWPELPAITDHTDQAQINAYSAAVDTYNEQVDRYNAEVDTYNAHHGLTTEDEDQ